jgi:Ca-activated chloride channel family protein
MDSFINIQPADEKPNYNASPYIYTKKKTSDYLRLPSTAGSYSLRWYNRSDKKALAERPIVLTAPEVTISVPDEIKAETEIEISWQAPKGLDAFINLQKAEEKPNYNASPYLYIKEKSSEYMKMPAETGEYVLRWYNRNDKKMLTEKKFTINSLE